MDHKTIFIITHSNNLPIEYYESYCMTYYNDEDLLGLTNHDISHSVQVSPAREALQICLEPASDTRSRCQLESHNDGHSEKNANNEEFGVGEEGRSVEAKKMKMISMSKLYIKLSDSYLIFTELLILNVCSYTLKYSNRSTIHICILPINSIFILISHLATPVMIKRSWISTGLFLII